MTPKKKPARRNPAKRAQPKRASPRMPYVQLIERHGTLAVWLVDCSYVPRNIHEKIRKFAHHFSRTAIPKDHICAYPEGVPYEQPFFLLHALVETQLSAQV